MGHPPSGSPRVGPGSVGPGLRARGEEQEGGHDRLEPELPDDAHPALPAGRSGPLPQDLRLRDREGKARWTPPDHGTTLLAGAEGVDGPARPRAAGAGNSGTGRHARNPVPGPAPPCGPPHSRGGRRRAVPCVPCPGERGGESLLPVRAGRGSLPVARGRNLSRPASASRHSRAPPPLRSSGRLPGPRSRPLPKPARLGRPRQGPRRPRGLGSSASSPDREAGIPRTLLPWGRGPSSAEGPGGGPGGREISVGTGSRRSAPLTRTTHERLPACSLDPRFTSTWVPVCVPARRHS